MDRNNLTGLLLIALLIIGWMYFFAPDTPKGSQTTTRTDLPTDSTGQLPAQPDSLKQATPTADTTTVVVGVVQSDSARLAGQFGAFAPVATGKAQQLRVQTEQLEVVLTSHGGQLAGVYLRDHKDFRGDLLPVMPEGPNTYQNLTFGHANLVIHSKDLYYTPSVHEDVTLSGEQVQQVRLRATVAPGSYLEHVYTFHGTGYEIGYELITVGLEKLIRGNFLDLTASVGIPWTEKNHNEQLHRTQVFYRSDEEVESLDAASDEKEEVTGLVSADWVSFKSMFFVATLMGAEDFSDVSVRAEPLVIDRDPMPRQDLQRLSADMRINLRSAESDSVRMTWFVGPTDRSLLAAYKKGLAEQLKLGWGPIGWINKGVIEPLFGLLQGFTHNYGIIILILAVFIKLVLSPLTYRSYVSNAKMQAVNNMPEVKELDEKYKDDPTKLQQMKMQFYSQVGVSPLAGCIPMLLQMPVFFAMFTFFPQSIELRQQPFLWADDLSSYDTLIDFGFKLPLLGWSHLSGFALLMTISQLGYTYVTQQSQTFTGPMASMKYMGYIFPFVFFFVLNSYSSGLSWYYLVMNVMTIVQTYAIKATINQDKLHDKILAAREKRSKSGKATGGGLGGWLEKQQKKQEQIIKERNDQRFGNPQKKGGAKPRK